MIDLTQQPDWHKWVKKSAATSFEAISSEKFAKQDAETRKVYAEDAETSLRASAALIFAAGRKAGLEEALKMDSAIEIVYAIEQLKDKP